MVPIASDPRNTRVCAEIQLGMSFSFDMCLHITIGIVINWVIGYHN